MLTNTERQQIVEEVNAGTYGIDEALDDIAAAQKGEEVRKALYAEALVLNREGHAGSTDMIARQKIANLQTSVNGQISTLRSEVGDDIDDLETALNSGLATQNGKIAAQDATIANVVANYNAEYGSTELWASTGETGALAAGTTVTLSEDVSHFDYIDIYSFCGNSNVLDTVPVDAKLQSSQGYALRWVNLSDPDSGSYKAYVRIIETRLHIIGTTLTIDHQVTYRNGEEVNISGAEITQSNRSTYMGELGIMKIVGRKITANTEIEDVRIGADGTTYNSAGQAVRAQVTALESAIPAVDSTLSTQGAAADAKVAGDKVAELKSALKYNSYDVFVGKTTRADSIHNGISYAWNGDTCTITGTATDYSVNNLIATSDLPSDIIPGRSYYVKTKTTNILARLRIIFFHDSETIQMLYIAEDTKIIIPSNANKWVVSIFVSNTAVFSSPVIVTVSSMLSSETNYELSEKLIDSLLSPFIPSESTFSVFDMPINSYWSGFKNAFSDSVDIASELLANVTYQVLKIGVFVYVVCPYSSQAFVGMVRKSDSAQFWINLKDMREGGVIPSGTDFDSLTSPGVYFMNSGYNYIHSPFSSTYDGEVVVLTDPAKTTSIIQIVVTYSPNGNNLIKLRMSLNGSFPSQWSDVGSTTKNYYTSEHYENTYNITATPTITADTNNYLTSTGDQTDRTADIQAILAQNGVCHLGPGLFMVSGVDIPDYKSITGSGNYTTVRLLPSVENGYVFKLNNQTSVSNLRISGGTTTPTLSSTVGTRHGILFEGTKISGQTGGVTHKRSSVDNVIISNFSGGGITCNGTGVDLDSNIMVTNCFIDHCNAGIYIPYYSEFHRFTNCAVTYCYYGCLNNGGNNVFVNCDFSGNRTGVLIDNATNQSPNNSHGTYSACTINHSYSDAGVINQGTAIELRKATNGEIFSGLQIHYGKIKISDSIAIRFSDCQFGRGVAMTITGSKNVTFLGCSMYSAAEDTVTQSGNTTLRFVECYTYAGDVYNPVA